MLRNNNVELNKRKSQQTGLIHKNLSQTKSFRKARARGLIQVGGLVKISGPLEVCGIEEGDDLQLDMESRDKAAILLGILMSTIPEDQQVDQALLNQWQEIGVRKLKMQEARKRY
jgi:hypothetical protein